MLKQLILPILLLISFDSFSKKKKNCFVKTCITCEDSCDESNECNGKTFFSIRPQDSNSVRRILNQTDKLGCCEDRFGINVTFEYQSSFNNENLANWFLGDDRECLTIGNSNKNKSFDIDGKQIGIVNKNFEKAKRFGKICFEPKIENFIVDFDFLFNLDNLVCGLWSRINLPVVSSKTQWNLKSESDGVQQRFFPNGFFTLNCTKTKSPFDSVLKALLGKKGFGEIPSLQCGRFFEDSKIRTGLASIQFQLGYDFIRNNCGNFGLYLHAVAPTGTRPQDKFLFSPVVGANRSWQIGIGTNSSIDIYNRCNSSSTFYIDAVLTHLFKSKQTRLFALKNNGPLSWLLLVKRFANNGDELIGADRLANILCGETKIGADAMLDGSIMFQFKYCHCFFNIGYNLWLRSREKRDDTVCFKGFTENGLAIKGNQPLSKLMRVACPGPADEFCKPNLTTASESTISNAAAKDRDQTFIQIEDIDFNAPLHPFAMSHKIFTSFGYNWQRRCVDGFVQVGFEAEFAHKKTAINQWGVLFSIGLTF